jgi:hypothetical protein
MKLSGIISVGLGIAVSWLPASAEVLIYDDPVLVSEIDVGRMPEISGDGLELFFARGDEVQLDPSDIWRTGRFSREASFATPTLVSEVNTPSYNETSPRLSPDELTLYFSTNRFNGWWYLGDMAKAVRSAKGSPFSGISAIGPLNDLLKGEEMGGVTEDGLQGVMARHPDLPLSSRFQIYSFWRPSVSSDWSSPQNTYVENLRETDSHNRSPWLSREGTMIVFAREVPGRHYDIFYATRPDTSSWFGVPIPLNSINTELSDAGPSLTDDLRIIFFHSNRQDGVTERIYSAELIELSAVGSDWQAYR